MAVAFLRDSRVRSGTRIARLRVVGGYKLLRLARITRLSPGTRGGFGGSPGLPSPSLTNDGPGPATSRPWVFLGRPTLSIGSWKELWARIAGFCSPPIVLHECARLVHLLVMALCFGTERCKSVSERILSVRPKTHRATKQPSSCASDSRGTQLHQTRHAGHELPPLSLDG